MAHLIRRTVQGLNDHDSSRDWVAFVNGNFFRHIAQADGVFKDFLGRDATALGTQQKITGVDLLAITR